MSAEIEPENLQRPIDTAADVLWDVLIAGAGPAGSTAAIHLAARGHAVLLVDKARFPREKVCGDALLADTLQCLRPIGLYEIVRQRAHRLSTARVYSPSRIEVVLPGTYLTLKRRVFDTLLARGAIEAGALFCHATVDKVTVRPDGTTSWGVAGLRWPLRARVGVVATGASVSLFNKLAAANGHGVGALAARCYVRSPATIDCMVFSYERRLLPGYGWIFPIGGGEYNVGCLVFGRERRGVGARLSELLATFATQCPLMRGLLRHAEEISALRGGVLRCGLKGAPPLFGGSLLAIGETAGATFPFTGEGIGKAMKTGELAADVVHRALSRRDLRCLSGFPGRLAAELKPVYRGYEAAQQWLARAWLTDLLMRRARTSRWLRDALAGMADESTDPQTVFSVGGLLSSFWR